MILSESTTDHAALRAPLKILVAEDSAATLPYCIITGSAIEKDQWVNELGLSPHCFILKPLTQAKLVEFLRAYSSLRPLAGSIEQNSLSISPEEAPPVP